MKLSGKFIEINHLISASYYVVSLITLLSFLKAALFLSFYLSSLSLLLFTFSLFTEYSFSLCELSVELLGSSSVLFGSCVSLNNGLYPVGCFSIICGRLESCWVINMLIY